MKTIITSIVLSLSLSAFAQATGDKDKLGHNKEHQHVKSEAKDHEHEDAHHEKHDHKAHHPDHKDETTKSTKK